MSDQHEVPTLAAVRLKELLDNPGLLSTAGSKLKKQDLAARLGMSVAWFSKLINQRGKAAGREIAPETLMVIAFLLRGRTEPFTKAFDELFGGTVEHDAFYSLPEPIQDMIGLLARLNSFRLGRQPLITRQTIADEFAGTIGWSRQTWNDVLQNRLALPEDAATRRALAAALGLDYQKLRYPDEPPPTDVIPDDLDWLAVDRLVAAKLKAPQGLEIPTASLPRLNREVASAMEQAAGKEAWDALPPDARDRLVALALPWAERWHYIDLVRHRAAGSTHPAELTAAEVIALAAAHLPNIVDSLRPHAAALKMGGMTNRGNLTRRYAALLGVSAPELALLLLGIGRPEHLPAAAAALRAAPARGKAANRKSK